MGSGTQAVPSGGINQVRKRGWENYLPKRPLRVLLVEDDDSTRQVVCALLCKCGYEVSPVSDGLKAWDLMERSENQFDLVLTDTAMPLLPGTELLAMIMNSEAHRDTPVIMMSAHDSLDVVFKCLLRGAKDFLVKPLRKNELRNLWQHVWRKNHLSSRIEGGSTMIGGRIKAPRSSGFDASSFSEDDASQNSDRSARSQSDNGSATQSLWIEPPTAEDLPMLPDRDSATQLGLTKYGSQKEDVHEDSMLGDVNTDQQSFNFKAPGKGLAMSPQQCLPLSEGSEAYERSAKAIDLIGTMTVESRPGKSFWRADDEKPKLGISESSALQDSSCLPQQRQSLPALELTLKRPNSNEDSWFHPHAKKSVKQSDCSAFSRYTSGMLFQQRQCIATGASIPSDQCSLAEVFRSLNGDGAVTINTTTSRVKPNERTAGMGNCGSSTLHFPRAVPFQQGRQEGNSVSCFLATGGDSDERSLPSLRSPPWKLSNSSLLSNETLVSGTHQTCTPNVQKQILSDSSPTGCVWSPRQTEVFGKEVCTDSGDHFDKESQLHRHRDPQSSSSVPELTVATLEQETFCQKQLLSTPSGIETIATERDTFGVLNMSGSGSNTGSNDGSNLYTCHLRSEAGKPELTQESCSFGDVVKTDENSVANYSGAAASEAEVHCAMQPPDFSRAILREAALNKFRQKRKVRCFEKKVRYQSRKKLADQRPRVKGQFVRQAVYDASLSKLEQGMVCS